jgi:hypothetical protein
MVKNEKTWKNGGAEEEDKKTKLFFLMFSVCTSIVQENIISQNLTTS